MSGGQEGRLWELFCVVRCGLRGRKGIWPVKTCATDPQIWCCATSAEWRLQENLVTKDHLENRNNKNVGQCPTWGPPCRIQAAPSVQRRKVWLAPTTRVPCSNAAKTRNPLKYAGVPQTNETISAASGLKFTILWGHVEEILLLNRFFVDTCLSCEDIALQSCAMVPRWWLFGDFCVLYFQRAVCSTFQTFILNLH